MVGHGVLRHHRRGRFLRIGKMPDCDAAITNLPYTVAQEFIEHALEMMKPEGLELLGIG
jgi:hypothetical protein